MNKEQYLRYLIIIVIFMGVLVFNHKGNKETPEEVQPSEQIQGIRMLHHVKHLK